MMRSIYSSSSLYLLSYLSRMQAWARPPSAQAVSKAKRWPSSCSLFDAVVTRRAPNNKMAFTKACVKKKERVTGKLESFVSIAAAEVGITKKITHRLRCTYLLFKRLILTSGTEGVAQGQRATTSVDLGEVEVTDNLASGQAVRTELLAAHRSHVRKHLACMDETS